MDRQQEQYLKYRVKTFTKGVKVGTWLGKAATVGLPLFEFPAKNLGAQQGKNPQKEE